MVGMYNYKFSDGSKTYGGYADYARVPSHFVMKIPDAIPSEEAAPMLCGGITVYSPLKKNGCGPKKAVGIVGIGGLGHFGILYAKVRIQSFGSNDVKTTNDQKALGAKKVVAISRSNAKKEDAQKMGADDFIATNDDPDWATHHANSLDLIVSTVSSGDMPLQNYLQLLRVNGTFIQVGAPEEPMPSFAAFALIAKGVKVGGSAIGAPHEIEVSVPYPKLLEWC